MTRLNLLMLVALLVSSVYLVRVSYEARRLFSDLDKAQTLHRQLDVEHERLQAERQAQATPSRVEKAAREKLAMRSAIPAVTHYVHVPAPVLAPTAPSIPPAGGRP